MYSLQPDFRFALDTRLHLLRDFNDFNPERSYILFTKEADLAQEINIERVAEELKEYIPSYYTYGQIFSMSEVRVEPFNYVNNYHHSPEHRLQYKSLKVLKEIE